MLTEVASSDFHKNLLSSVLLMFSYPWCSTLQLSSSAKSWISVLLGIIKFLKAKQKLYNYLLGCLSYS